MDSRNQTKCKYILKSSSITKQIRERELHLGIIMIPKNVPEAKPSSTHAMVEPQPKRKWRVKLSKEVRTNELTNELAYWAHSTITE